MSIAIAAVITAGVSSAVSIGTSYLGAKELADAAKEAGSAEERMHLENLAYQKDQEEKQVELFEPWKEVGEEALEDLWQKQQAGDFVQNSFIPPPKNIEIDPGYKFRFDEGVDALDKSASARGRMLSGAQRRELTRYGQGIASQEYQNAYNRYSSDYARSASDYDRESQRRGLQFNILNQLSGQGYSAATNQARAIQAASSNVGNVYNNRANSQGNAIRDKGKAYADGWDNFSTAVSEGGENAISSIAMLG